MTLSDNSSQRATRNKAATRGEADATTPPTTTTTQPPQHNHRNISQTPVPSLHHTTNILPHTSC
jgi:hypothetical protein